MRLTNPNSLVFEDGAIDDKQAEIIAASSGL